jgi:hypothetical protein
LALAKRVDDGNRRSNRRERDLVPHQLVGAGQMPSFDASAVAS